MSTDGITRKKAADNAGRMLACSIFYSMGVVFGAELGYYSFVVGAGLFLITLVWACAWLAKTVSAARKLDEEPSA